MPHDCVKFKTFTRSEPMQEAGPLTRTQVVVGSGCVDCGRVVKPRAGTRAPRFIDEESAHAQPIHTRSLAALAIGKALRAKASGNGWLRWSTLERRFLEAFGPQALAAGAQELVIGGLAVRRLRRQGAQFAPHQLRSKDVAALEEFLDPGNREAVEAARQAAMAKLGSQHPLARRAHDFLASMAVLSWTPAQIRALAELALHAQTGTILPVAVFSARRLGDSKQFSAMRNRICTILGPLDDLGLRANAAVDLIGGKGHLELGDAMISLDELRPFVGLAKETVLRVNRIKPSEDGIIFVENKAVFEACCRGDVKDLGEPTVVFMGGQPGEAVLHLAAISRVEVPVRVWTDMDPEGVQFVRRLNAANPRIQPYRMRLADFDGARQHKTLADNKKRESLRGGLADSNTLLREILTRIDETKSWVEQEVLL